MSSEKIAHIESQVQKSIDAFSNSSKWYRGRYYVFAISTAIISALIAVIAGWSSDIGYGAIQSDDIILILSAVSSVISVWGAFFSPRNSWHMYSEHLNSFRKLKAKIEYLKAEDNEFSDRLCNSLFDDYQSIHDQANKAWLDMRKNGSGSA